jgi:hypothetical protein
MSATDLSKAKTIRIFIPDGNPRSVRFAEITTRNVQAILIPRSGLDYASTRDELNSGGVYFLIGNPNEESKPLLYVGEAEDCFSRLKQHNRSKDFWGLALAIVSSSRLQYTKTQTKYLEWHCYTEAQKAGRFRLENSTIPNKPYVSEALLADLLDNFKTIKVLVSTLGYPLFDEIKKPQKKDILICKVKNVNAEGKYTEDGLIVFKGSTCRKEETDATGARISGLRAKLIEEGILIVAGSVYRFTDDYIFSSPSAASGVITGRRSNGWVEWKFEDGRTLDEVIRGSESKSQSIANERCGSVDTHV